MNFEVQRNFNVNSTLVALFEIHCRSLFFDVEKRRQYSEVTPIHTLRSLVTDLFKRDAFRLYRDWS